METASLQIATYGGFVYMMMNKGRVVIYTGVTSDLIQRAKDHRAHKYPDSYSARYNCEVLVWFERFGTITEAIAREKQIKGGSRKKKLALIHAMNPEMKDLAEEWLHL